MSDLSTATVDELINELKARTKAVLVIRLDDLKKDVTRVEEFVVDWRGSFTTIVGMIHRTHVRFQNLILGEAGGDGRLKGLDE